MLKSWFIPYHTCHDTPCYMPWYTMLQPKIREGFVAIKPFGPIVTKIFTNRAFPVFGWAFIGCELLNWPIWFVSVASTWINMTSSWCPGPNSSSKHSMLNAFELVISDELHKKWQWNQLLYAIARCLTRSLTCSQKKKITHSEPLHKERVMLHSQNKLLEFLTRNKGSYWIQ